MFPSHDPLALRCEYSEYNTEEYINNYQLEEEFNDYIKDYELEDESKEKQLEEFFNDNIGENDDFCAGEYDCFIVSTY